MGSGRAVRAVAVALLLAGCSTSAGTSPVGSGPSSAQASPPAAAPSFAAVREVARRPLPQLLRIPSLGVEAAVGPVGTAADGTVEVPERWSDVGWWSGGARPGEDGPSVLLGHVDSKAGPAVFVGLPDIRRGAVVEVVGEGGQTVRFAVERVEQHPKTRFPTDAVYLPALHPELRLVTCGGTFDRAAGHYRDNVVVYASLVG